MKNSLINKRVTPKIFGLKVKNNINSAISLFLWLFITMSLLPAIAFWRQ